MSEPGAAPAPARVLPLWLTVVLGVAGAAIAFWGIRNASWILAPVLLAFVLTVVAHPMIGALQRRGMRRPFAVALTVIALDGGLLLFAAAIAFSFSRLATVLPQYSDEWQHLLDDAKSALAKLGIGKQQITDALHNVQPSTVLSAIEHVLSHLLGSAGALVLVLATVLFMTAESAGLPARLAAAPGSARLTAALGGFAKNTRRYIVVTTVFGFLVAVADTIALLILGVPLALLWGLLSFLTNYVPNIGFLLGLVPPTLLALLVGGPGLAVLVVLIYSLANFVIQSVIQPVFVGDAVGLSVTLSFLSVFVWTVVLGPMGAILAVPLTLLVTAVLVGQDPDRVWARTLVAGASGAAASPPSGRRTRRRTRRRSAEPDDEVASEASHPPRTTTPAPQSP
jgi:predicted PurR-regulated permease PerM